MAPSAHRETEIVEMTLRKLIAIASMLAAFSIAGCGDSANNVCDNCEISDQRELCESAFNNCTAGDCEARALAACADPV